MEVNKLLELMSKLKSMNEGMRSAMDLVDVIEKSMVTPVSVPPGSPPEMPVAQTPIPRLTVETPTAPLIDAKRLDRIWKYLQRHLESVQYAKLRDWASKEFDYTYYVLGQKYPCDLRPEVCNKLKGFDERQISELEQILGAEE